MKPACHGVICKADEAGKKGFASCTAGALHGSTEPLHTPTGVLHKTAFSDEAAPVFIFIPPRQAISFRYEALFRFHSTI